MGKEQNNWKSRLPEQHQLYLEKENAWKELKTAEETLRKTNENNPAWIAFRQYRDEKKELLQSVMKEADDCAGKMREMYRQSDEAREYDDIESAKDYGEQGRAYEARSRELNEYAANLRSEINTAREKAKEEEKGWPTYQELFRSLQEANHKYSTAAEKLKMFVDETNRLKVEKHIFADSMEPGIDLIRKKGLLVPDYLNIGTVKSISVEDHIDPSALEPITAYVYGENTYLTDDKGQIAFVDLHLKHVSPTEPLRKAHPEARRSRKRGDAGHFGLSIGQHPSITMDQNVVMNRWGIWRALERYWNQLLLEGIEVHLFGVFEENGDFWCFQEDGGQDYILTNDENQS